MQDTTTEQELRRLLDVLQTNAIASLSWRKAMARLLRLVPQLPGLARVNHPSYPEIWNDTLLRISQEIQDFERPPENVVGALVNWINLKLRLKYAVKDLQRGDRRSASSPTPQSEFRYQAKQPPLSLDRPLTTDATTTFGEQLRAPTLATLEEHIAQAQQAEKQEAIAHQLQTYIEQDPDARLRTCHPKKYPQAHAQLLALRLLLKDPPDRLSQIARELTINYHTLNWHWQHKALPLLRAIALDWGYSPPDRS